MYHYIYKTVSESGLYYIGRHSTLNLDDEYLGSGIWIRKQKDKKKLKKTILEYCDSFEELLEKERRYIQECINDESNMNFNDSSVGAATGKLNISHRLDVKEKLRKRMTEDNPMKKGHSDEAKEKIRHSMVGELNHFFGKSHSQSIKKMIGEKNKGKVWTDEQKQNLSELRKKQFKNQKPSYLVCVSHTEETKDKIRQSALNRKKIECPYCKMLCSPNTAKRWHYDNCKQKTELGL
jgi:ferredoxin-like protein FixX